jgi:hypothetical protein
MSSDRRRNPASAARAIGQPPTAIELRYSGSATARDARRVCERGRHGDREQHDRRHRRHAARVATPERRLRLAASPAQRLGAVAGARHDGLHLVGPDITLDGQGCVAERHARGTYPVQRCNGLLDRLRA